MRVLRRVITSFTRAVVTSLRYRLVLLTALTIVMAVAMSGIGVYQAARVSFYGQLDQELLAIAESTAEQMSVDLKESTVSSLTSLDTENVLVLLVGANTNRRVFIGDESALGMLGPYEFAVARIQTGSSARDGSIASGTLYRIVAVPFIDRSTGDAYALVVARELGPTADGLANLAAMQWLIGLVAVLLCVIAATFVATATLNPIRQLTSVVSKITATDKLSTIEVQGALEIADLERSFNTMMESLTASRTQQERLIADAGHELRTPLTSLRTNIELLIADETSKMLPDGARTEILSDVAAQLGEFTSLVNDLVMLSRGDVAPSSLFPLDFSGVVDRAVARAVRRGPGLVFDVVTTPVYVLGDPVALERAVTNLLDNAVKFSPPGGRITVRLDPRGLRIEDEGPGVAEEDIPHIFDRFYRSDSSRNTPGTGLGLSIVDHTVTAHQGTVEVSRAASGGACFLVCLPEVEPDE